MSEIYAMRRANGDWFALQALERLRIPLFQSSHDAMIARLRNFGMFLFKPVGLDARLLAEILQMGAAGDVDYCLVKDPLAKLKRASPVEPAQLALLIRNPAEPQTVLGNGNGFRASGIPLPKVPIETTGSWEDEGGSLQRVLERERSTPRNWLRADT
jgi:hypothetical protein